MVFGNLVMEMPVGLRAVAQTGRGCGVGGGGARAGGAWGGWCGVEGAVTAGATCDRGLTGKHRVQTPASNLLVINQTEEMPHTKKKKETKKTAARFPARGHFSRGGKQHTHPAHWCRYGLKEPRRCYICPCQLLPAWIHSYSERSFPFSCARLPAT